MPAPTWTALCVQEGPSGVPTLALPSPLGRPARAGWISNPSSERLADAATPPLPCATGPQGVLVDLYVPRKCSATGASLVGLVRHHPPKARSCLPFDPAPPPSHPGRLITAKDHASIQITVADVDANGVAIKGAAGTVIALVGQVRANAEADDSINRLATQAGRASLPSAPSAQPR